MTNEVQCVWDLRATLGEGPIWLPTERCLWFVDIKKQLVHRFDPTTMQSKSFFAPTQAGFIVPISHSNEFIVGLKTGLHRFNPNAQTNEDAFRLWKIVEPSQPNNRLNDGYVDAKGRLWFGSMDDGETESTGALYCMKDEATPMKVDAGYCITNGQCVSPDGHTLYHTDTVTRTIYAFDLDEFGALSNKRVFIRIDEKDGHPDGSIVDAEGCLWTGLWSGWKLIRTSPKGERITAIAMPCANVTKAAFGGDDLRTLYITTARKGLSAEQLTQQPQAGGLFSIRVDVPGLPQNAYRLG